MVVPELELGLFLPVQLLGITVQHIHQFTDDFVVVNAFSGVLEFLLIHRNFLDDKGEGFLRVCGSGVEEFASHIRLRRCSVALHELYDSKQSAQHIGGRSVFRVEAHGKGSFRGFSCFGICGVIGLDDSRFSISERVVVDFSSDAGVDGFYQVFGVGRSVEDGFNDGRTEFLLNSLVLLFDRLIDGLIEHLVQRDSIPFLGAVHDVQAVVMGLHVLQKVAERVLQKESNRQPPGGGRQTQNVKFHVGVKRGFIEVHRLVFAQSFHDGETEFVCVTAVYGLEEDIGIRRFSGFGPT